MRAMEGSSAEAERRRRKGEFGRRPTRGRKECGRFRMSAPRAYDRRPQRRGKQMLKKSLIVVMLTAFALGTVALAQNPPVSPSPIKRTPIGKTEVPGVQYEVMSAMVEIAPGFKA